MRAVHATHRRRWGIAVSMLLLASLASTSPAMAGSARSSTPLRPLPWGKEIQISGHGDPGVFTSLSCAASGDCTAVGYWSVGTVSVDEEGFILDEEHGRWGRPFAVPGLTASQRLGSTVVSVSCRAPGWCVAGGSAGFGFVVDEQRGVWGGHGASRVRSHLRHRRPSGPSRVPPRATASRQASTGRPTRRASWSTRWAAPGGALRTSRDSRPSAGRARRRWTRSRAPPTVTVLQRGRGGSARSSMPSSSTSHAGPGERARDPGRHPRRRRRLGSGVRALVRRAGRLRRHGHDR